MIFGSRFQVSYKVKPFIKAEVGVLFSCLFRKTVKRLGDDKVWIGVH